MKVLIPVLLICTLLLYVPFHLIKKDESNINEAQTLGKPITYIEEYTDSIDHLLSGDVVIFNTDPPYFALVDKLLKGGDRMLMVTPDSTITKEKNKLWIRKAFLNDQLDFRPSPRHINIDEKFADGGITNVFRKKKTNFYYRPIFIGVYTFSLFFPFFFIITIFSFSSKKSMNFVLVASILIGLLWFIYVTSHSSEWKYAYGNWKERLAYLSISILTFTIVLQLVSKNLKRVNDNYTKQGIKFAITCAIAPLSVMLSFKLLEWIYPPITMLMMYEGGKLHETTLWSYYYCGYTFAVANLLSFGIQKYNSLKSEKQIAVTTQLNTTAQLNSLQARLNPHFLYNALNSIASLIKTNPEKAEEMTINVSNFMRHFSNRKLEHLTPVSEEVSMIKEYLEIEKIRFEDKLRYNIDVSAEAMSQPIPRSLLQPLVENAIKYGYNDMTETIQVNVIISQQQSHLIIAVQDTGVDFSDALDKGYGLSSVYDKLSLLYGEAYDCL